MGLEPTTFCMARETRRHQETSGVVQTPMIPRLWRPVYTPDARESASTLTQELTQDRVE
jgi:hypothetical protein